MSPGWGLYWLAVAVVMAAVAAGHAAYRRALKRRGYWVRDGDSLLLPILILVLLVAIAAPRLLGF